MKVLFRSDSSSKIGVGHLMRDIVLAKKYANDEILFAVKEDKGNMNHKIEELGYKKIVLKTSDNIELIEVIERENIDLLVIDHYDIGYLEEKEIKDRTRVKIISFDDTYEKHYCDILLNHNIYAENKRYKYLLPKECKIWCGERYTLLRDEFLNIKKTIRDKRVRKDIKTIFVAMGGADHSNINIDILKVIKRYKYKKRKIRVNLVTTIANKNLNTLKNYCRNKKWISLYINSSEIAKLLNKSDLAIVTPSVIMNEVYYLKTPVIAIKTADNQKEMYNFLKKNRYMVLKEFNSYKFLEKLSRV